MNKQMNCSFRKLPVSVSTLSNTDRLLIQWADQMVALTLKLLFVVSAVTSARLWHLEQDFVSWKCCFPSTRTMIFTSWRKAVMMRWILRVLASLWRPPSRSFQWTLMEWIVWCWGWWWGSFGLSFWPLGVICRHQLLLRVFCFRKNQGIINEINRDSAGKTLKEHACRKVTDWQHWMSKKGWS